MSTTSIGDSTARKALRLWPGIAAAALLVLISLGLPMLFPDLAIVAVLGGVAIGAAILAWWLFFSRAPWSERLGAVVLMLAAVLVTRSVVHVSIRGGMMGMMLPIYSVPVMAFALVAWAVATSRASPGVRWSALVATVLVACGAWTMVRTEGITGGGAPQLHWRWTPTPEERLLAQAPEIPAAPVPAAASAGAPAETPRTVEPPAPVPPQPAPPPAEGLAAATRATASPGPGIAEWPGFRGARRDDVVPGVRIATNWTASPPAELWRTPIGPGWSSFAVGGGLLYTQEQRGEDEVVACYDAASGAPVWMHRDAVRFWESNGGAGPRATPTLSRGRVYTQGATGIVNALDARDGALAWSRNASTDTGVETPGWGFAGSPLVVQDLVIVAVSGALAAYDADTGDPRWSRGSGGGSYSSPQLVTIDGTPQILLMNGGGLISVAPADGTLLWQHDWPGVPIVQPALIGGGDFLVTTADMSGALGIRRIAVARGADGWKAEERWTSRGLKPYFNDFVVHNGYAFGFDGSILACIDLADGGRKWKGGRYGNGQLLLLADEDILLVLSEDGELALVRATPDRFTEVARFKAIEGKTWNHPVLVGGTLLVRNGEEMAAFRLATVSR